MDSEFLAALFYSVFITVSVMSGLICLHHYVALGAKPRYLHVLVVALSYFANMICWLEVLVIMMNLPIAVYTNTFFSWICMINVVLLYHFFYLVTGVGQQRRFSPVHYVIPTLIAIGLTAWASTIPFEVRSEVLFYTERISSGLSAFAIVYILLPLSYTIYGLIYAVFTYRRMILYHREVLNFSADARRTSPLWITYFLLFLLASTCAPVFSVLAVNLGIPSWLHVTLIPIPLGLIFLAYNVVMGNYVIIESTASEVYADDDRQTRAISRPRFEYYMEKKKPYLNPNLCITDMLEELNTNRTYLSNFINNEYHMNFNDLMNYYRLREIERLRLDESLRKQNSLELIQKAGFSSYRGYIAAGRREYRHKLIPRRF
ncbi:MAG: hypothetical protein LBN06_04860 [Prevotellaceae bacterium]|jgi:AraC-like DNA-binding protein|nr:hypothetical protein [Prevotellaceae bacterium]